MVKITKLKEMNSCHNWHCCCHTIIPKKRRQDFRQYRSPAKNSRLDLESGVGDQTSSEPTSSKATSSPHPEFQNTDEIQNGVMGDENGSSHSESECDENPQNEIVSNESENLNDLADEEPEIQSDPLILTVQSSEGNEGSSSPEMIQSESHDILETEADEEELKAVEKSENEEEVEEKVKEVVENTSEAPNVETVVTNGILEESKNEEKEDVKDVKTKVEIEAKVPKVLATKAAVSVPTTPKSVEIKDKEQPSTSTGASTGRYNCRNREKFHKCLKCGKMFFQLDSFVRHEKEHLLEETKPCYCTVCNRSYTSMSSFSRHLKTHINCVQCNKTFSQAEVGKVSPGGNNFNCSECKKNSSPQPPVLQPEGPIKTSEVVKSKVESIKTKIESVKNKTESVKIKMESANHLPLNNGSTSTVYARKSVPVFIEKKSEPGTVVKKVKQLGLQSSHLKIPKEHSSFLKCNECDRRFPNLTTLKNHRTLHTTT